MQVFFLGGGDGHTLNKYGQVWPEISQDFILFYL